MAFLLMPIVVYSQNLPKPTNYISDFAGVVEADYAAAINQFSLDLEKNTSSQIFVATIEDTSPSSPKDYATKLFEQWKPGQKDKDNGIIVLLAFKPERRVEIEVGYGLEGLIPDSKAARIAREYAPLLTEGKYGEGLHKIVEALGRVIKGSGEFSGSESSVDWDSTFIGIVIFIVFFLLVVGIIKLNRPPKCSKCGSRMTREKTSEYGDYIIEEFVCKNCGEKTKKKKKKPTPWHGIVVVGGGRWGSGGSGGGFGGGGGGSSGGGGGGSGF